MMKTWFVCAGALALAACGSSQDATAALEAMNLGDGSSDMIRYESKSGSGDKVTLKNVVLGPEGSGLSVATMTFGGLALTEGGKPLFTSLAMKDMKPEQVVPGVDFTLASITMDKLNPTVGEFLAGSFSEAGPGDPPPFEAWGFGKISVNGMAVKGDLAAMGMGGGAFTVNLAELSVSDLKDTVFGAGKFSGLKGDFDIPVEVTGSFPVAGTFDFGTADVKGVRGGIFADAFGAGMAAAMDPAAMSTLQADIMSSLSSPIEAGYDSLTWTPMTIDAAGAKFTTTRLEHTVTRNADGVATGSTVPRFAMTFATDSAGGALGQMAGVFLSMVGYPTVEIYGASSASFDPATDTTRYEDYTFGLTDGFDLNMKGGFQGLTEAISTLMTLVSGMDPTLGADPFDPDAPLVPPAPDLGGLAALKVVDLEITLTDKSFVDKMLNLAPMMGGGDAATMRADIVNMLSAAGADLSASGVDPGIANELMAAVAAFVENPGTLSVKLAPAQPVALAEEGATLTKTSLGFSASHTPAN